MDNQTNQEKVLADFVALIASNDQSKQAAIQQKLEEIMKSGGMTHEAMFKKLQAIQAEQVRSKAAAAPKQQPPPHQQPGHPALKSSVDEGPFLSTLSADASAYPISATLSTTNPGPVPWPPAPSSSSGPSGSRPTLTGGNTTGRISGTPAQILREEPLPITFTPDHRTQPGGAGGAARKANAGGPGEMSMRRTIHDLVASVDPNVKIEPEVEDLLLSIADEFIDSVTNFSCRLAKHRGGDTLEVRDLQLHLERNHNIRIPGFSSDDTRISLSQASSAILPPAPPAAAAATKRGGAGAGAAGGGGTHMTLRSQRLAQVALAKREGRGV
ncbi:transcription initiation factor TFIID subunit A-domain-containing protein [Mycena albidolilacea]|uniref:TBP-associated factor 12 n=1 Tax=Mycena albidolilacea TaxID=1033008 RepID=A0AAD6Z7S2_9AGAR|nr:transcription initiation factor TFIID subunit A-domain-containing protein [Mycena albidolilacea]